MNVTRRYKYRIYPTVDQAINFSNNFGFARFAYNWALDRKSKAYRLEGVSLSHTQLDKEWNTHKKDIDWIDKSIHSQMVAQQAIRDLDQAFNRFFAKKAHYPKFKAKQSGGSARYTTNGFRFKDGRLYVAKNQNPVRMKLSRPLPNNPTSMTVIRDAANRWFVSFVVEVKTNAGPPTDLAVGIDMGIKDFATFSNGQKVANPKFLDHKKRKIKRLEQEVSRKQKGSSNQRKARQKLARQHAKVVDSRRDFQHKLSTSIVRENQVIAIEDLATKNMMGNPNLARHIADAGWRQFRTVLEYKCQEMDRHLLIADRFFPSSKMCSSCGHIYSGLTLADRLWTCTNCATVHDRDVNAAKNILAVGLTESQNVCGDSVRQVYLQQ